ncbi:hypothetical protein N7451_003265 [Penicillium sp. IBT 35674x]|nr:hypothetical protein N7451_003265 [Penicillium sp. IBT 35674x]
MAGDGTSCSLPGLEPEQSHVAVHRNVIWEHRKQLIEPSEHDESKIEDHPEYTLVTFTPAKSSSKTMSSHRRGIISVLVRVAGGVEAEASPSNSTELSDQKSISINGALSALLAL